MTMHVWNLPVAMLLTLTNGCLFIVPAPVFDPVPDHQVVVGQRLAADLATIASDPEDRPLTVQRHRGTRRR